MLKFLRIKSTSIHQFTDFLDRKALAFFAVWTLFTVSHHLILGPYSFLPLNDAGDLSIPRQLAGLGQYFSFPRPSWSPMLIGGADNLAAMLDPNIDGLLHLIFPTWLAVGLSVWITSFVTAYFLYSLLRNHLQCPGWVSLGCALAISPVYPMYPQPQPLAVIVLAMWAVPWANSNLRIGVAAFICLGVLAGASSGYAYAIFHLPALMVGMLALWPNLRTVILVLAFVAGYFAYDGTALTSAIVNAPLSNRDNLGLTGSWLLNWSTFTSDLRNWGWVFVLSIAAALLAGSTAARHWLLAGATALIIATPLIAFFAMFMLLNDAVLGQSIRTHIGMPLLAFVATGVAVPVVVARVNKLISFKLEPILVVTGVAVFLTAAVLEKIGGGIGWRPRGTNFASAFDHPDLHGLWRKTRGFRPFRVATVVGTRMSFRQETMFPVSYGFEMADGYINLFSKRYYRYWNITTAGIQRRLSAHLGYKYDGGQMVALYDLKGGLRAMCDPKPVSECGLHFSEFYNLDMLSLANMRYLISPVTIKGAGLKLLQSANREKLLARERVERRKKLNALLAGTYNPNHTLYIYENTRVLPRSFVAGDVRIFDDSEDVLAALAFTAVEDLAARAFVARPDLIEAGQPVEDLIGLAASRYSDAYISVYENDRLVIETATETPGVLVVSNNYSPFWEACVNGKKAHLFPIYHTYQGVIVDGGKSRTELVYNPPYRIGGLKFCGG